MEQSPEWCQVASEVPADSPSALGCGSELPTRGIEGRMPKSWSSLKQEASWAPSWASDSSLAPLLRPELLLSAVIGLEVKGPAQSQRTAALWNLGGPRPSPSLQLTPWQPLGHLW